MILRIFITVVFSAAFLFAQNNGLQNKFALAQSYEHSGDFEKASKIYEELYQREPQNNLYFESLNRTYVQLKNDAASVNLIEKEIAKKPNDINLYGLLGSTYSLMGNEEKAYQVWDEPFSFLEPNPNPQLLLRPQGQGRRHGRDGCCGYAQTSSYVEAGSKGSDDWIRQDAGHRYRYGRRYGQGPEQEPTSCPEEVMANTARDRLRSYSHCATCLHQLQADQARHGR